MFLVPDTDILCHNIASRCRIMTKVHIRDADTLSPVSFTVHPMAFWAERLIHHVTLLRTQKSAARFSFAAYSYGIQKSPSIPQSPHELRMRSARRLSSYCQSQTACPPMTR